MKYLLHTLDPLQNGCCLWTKQCVISNAFKKNCNYTKKNISSWVIWHLSIQTVHPKFQDFGACAWSDHSTCQEVIDAWRWYDVNSTLTQTSISTLGIDLTLTPPVSERMWTDWLNMGWDSTSKLTPQRTALGGFVWILSGQCRSF